MHPARSAPCSAQPGVGDSQPDAHLWCSTSWVRPRCRATLRSRHMYTRIGAKLLGHRFRLQQCWQQGRAVSEALQACCAALALRVSGRAAAPTGRLPAGRSEEGVPSGPQSWRRRCSCRGSWSSSAWSTGAPRPPAGATAAAPSCRRWQGPGPGWRWCPTGLPHDPEAHVLALQLLRKLHTASRLTGSGSRAQALCVQLLHGMPCWPSPVHHLTACLHTAPNLTCLSKGNVSSHMLCGLLAGHAMFCACG